LHSVSVRLRCGSNKGEKMKKFGHVSTMGALFFASALLSGCATSRIDLSKYRDADLKEAEIMPTKDQLNQQRIKVVVFEADEGGLANAVDAHLGASLTKAVEKEFSSAGAEVVDRNLAGKLSDELKLAELQGSGGYEGPQVAQFAIRGKLISAEYGARYYEATTWKDKKGEYHVNPAYFEHQARVTGSVSVYELPSLRLVTTVNVGAGVSVTDPRTPANRQTGASLLRSATGKAVSDSDYLLKNLVAPKGYVVERRTDGTDSIFKILIGRGQGAKQEDKVVIYSLRKKTNALTGKEQTEEMPVAEAKVSDQIGETESWVIPENKDAAAKVRLGDYVKVKYEEKSFFSRLAQ
jgi:hypothetical protein